MKTFHPKYWKSEILAFFFFIIFFSDFITEVYVLNRFLDLLNYQIKHWKNTGNGKKILEKSGGNQGNLLVRKYGNHDYGKMIFCLHYCKITICFYFVNMSLVFYLQSNIGLILHAVGEYDLSLRFLQKALELNTK